jgi:ankyrin repeat protein
MIPHLRLHRNNLPLIQTPLTLAIENRITPEQAQSNLFSAIDFADENEFATLCDAAISHGANVNTNNVFGQHPIACAILRGSLPILRCLFARGALTPNPDANGYDIVMIAALSNHADVMEFLITDGNMLNDAKDIIYFEDNYKVKTNFNHKIMDLNSIESLKNLNLVEGFYFVKVQNASSSQTKKLLIKP